MTYPGAADKSGPLKYTTHYVFNSADCLGKGATATVYLGRHRETGDVVAVKVFNNTGSRGISKAREREIDLLKHVQHKNVMRMLVCEKELSQDQDVIVMEYCQGGSVFTLLEQPEYGFGFHEKEFIKFITDLSSGLAYMRSRGFIHRDIKPGNILKRIDPDGSTSFVVTDFGAARELGDEETFVSIYGTEEYLHPHMYKRAVLRQSGTEHFNSSVDLWSLGVTIYHVACGQLPFQSYGGRSDAETLYRITSSREPGVISGIQKQPRGSITWSRALPSTCHLPRGLRCLLGPVIAGLLDGLPYDQFFNAVNDISSRVKLRVFNALVGSTLAVYVKPTDSLVHVREHIAAQTDIPWDKQLLLISHKEIGDVVDAQTEVGHYGQPILSSTLVLYTRDESDCHRLLVPEIPPFPFLREEESLGNDALQARRCTAVAYYLETKVEEMVNNRGLLLEAVFSLRHYIEDQLMPIQVCVPKIDLSLHQIDRRLQFVKDSQVQMSLFVRLLSALGKTKPAGNDVINDANSFCSKDEGLIGLMKKATVRLNEIKLYMSVLIQKLVGTGNAADVICCHDSNEWLSKTEQLKMKIQGISSTFAKHKRYGTLHQHEVFIHTVEKGKLEDLCVSLLCLYQDQCVRHVNSLHSTVQKQNSTLLKHLTRKGKVETNVRCVEDCLTQLGDKLDKISERFTQLVESCRLTTETVLSAGVPVSIVPGEDKDRTSAGGGHGLTDVSREVKSSLMDKVIAELSGFDFKTAELDNLLKSNTDSLMELKRLLDAATSLNPLSIVKEDHKTEDGS